MHPGALAAGTLPQYNTQWLNYGLKWFKWIHGKIFSAVENTYFPGKAKKVKKYYRSKSKQGLTTPLSQTTINESKMESCCLQRRHVLAYMIISRQTPNKLSSNILKYRRLGCRYGVHAGHNARKIFLFYTANISSTTFIKLICVQGLCNCMS